jgi:hypothetical protein
MFRYQPYCEAHVFSIVIYLYDCGLAILVFCIFPPNSNLANKISMYDKCFVWKKMAQNLPNFKKFLFQIKFSFHKL